jgi:hypothetical protein
VIKDLKKIILDCACGPKVTIGFLMSGQQEGQRRCDKDVTVKDYVRWPIHTCNPSYLGGLR